MIGKDEWTLDYEDACEALTAGEIDEPTFRNKLRSLGFDEDEIDEEIKRALT